MPLLLTLLLLALGRSSPICAEDLPQLSDAEAEDYTKALNKTCGAEIPDLTSLHVTPCQFSLYLDALYSASKDPVPHSNHLFLTDAMNVDGEHLSLSLCDIVLGFKSLRQEYDHLTHIFAPSATSHVDEADGQPGTNLTQRVAMVDQKFCSDCAQCPEELCSMTTVSRCGWSDHTGCSHLADIPTKMPTDGPTDSPAHKSPIPAIFLQGQGYGVGAGYLEPPTAGPAPPPDKTQKHLSADDTLAAQIVSPGTEDGFRPKLQDFFLAASSITWLGLVIYLIKTRECRSCSSGFGECSIEHNNMEPFIPIEHHFRKQREGEVSEVESDVHFEQIEGGRRDTFPVEAAPQSEVILPGHFTRGLSGASSSRRLSAAGRSTKTSSCSFLGVDHLPQYMSEAEDHNSEYRDVDLEQETDVGGAEPSDDFATAHEHPNPGPNNSESDQESIASSNSPSTVCVKDTTPEANRQHYYKSAGPVRINIAQSDSESDSVIVLTQSSPPQPLLDRPRAANRARARKQPPPLPFASKRPSESPPRIGPGHELYRPSESPPSTKEVVLPREEREFQFSAGDLLLELEKSDSDPAPEKRPDLGLKDSAAQRMQFIQGLAMDGSSETESDSSNQ